MIFHEISYAVRRRAESREIRMACFALVSHFHVVVACTACRHRRHIRRGSIIGFIQSGVACDAFHFFIACMFFVVEVNFAYLSLERRGIFFVHVTVAARLAHLFFMTCLAYRVSRQHFVGRRLTRHRLRMTRSAINPELIDVFLM